MMLALERSEDRKQLEELLAQSVPESMRVYGTVFYINRGNPLNMEVLVDSWPDFKTVISKPRSMEMVNDTNLCRHIYHVFTKDAENLREILGTTDVINWNQCLQIEGLQQCLDPVITSIAESKGLELERDKALLFVRDIHLGVSGKSPSMNSEEKSAAQIRNHLKVRDDQLAFHCSPLRDAEAELVNAFWMNGGNESSLKYARQCIQHLPSLCIRDPGGKPISWCVMDQTSEIRMVYTLPEYRSKGLFTNLLISFMAFLCLQWDDFPFHFITSKDNVQIQSVARKVGLPNAPCGFFQWICQPQRRHLRETSGHQRFGPKRLPQPVPWRVEVSSLPTAPWLTALLALLSSHENFSNFYLSQLELYFLLSLML
ncbi:glycine N-acyltransferase-like isoform X1 [Pleurodeles waltl]|uniref:glycine N-acyltransferase-like isoform X1 n=2 Tax=Pleurodeles waltl TaxID=8319 RepID=UPI003709909B